jgi:hypothetical protein
VPVINANDLQASRIVGADHEATISLILDESEPGQGPRLHVQARLRSRQPNL